MEWEQIIKTSFFFIDKSKWLKHLNLLLEPYLDGLYAKPGTAIEKSIM